MLPRITPNSSLVRSENLFSIPLVLKPSQRGLKRINFFKFFHMQLPDLLTRKRQVSSSTMENPRSSESFDTLEKDVALALVGEHAQPIDPVVEARVIRKIDIFLIPAMIIGMLFLRQNGRPKKLHRIAGSLKSLNLGLRLQFERGCRIFSISE
jgi:hypothetical protein